MYCESGGECDDHLDLAVGVGGLKTLHFCARDCVPLIDLRQFIIFFNSL
jgi:hypothetical protein